MRLKFGRRVLLDRQTPVAIVTADAIVLLAKVIEGRIFHLYKRLHT